eukprot:TRINITY_DN7619_c0_g1_i2.p2 TRINITY_DN7619_c0_g1~~TRINITY_DN7619_c0_g1_i2.p2  ORF type:complete len:300 (+),score=115.25 TRINITY_DN7619_c0_g1_i2:60-959(+)
MAVRRCRALLANPMHMHGYPVDPGKSGYGGSGMIGGYQTWRMQNRHADALDWNIIVPEWYWERGGYEKMGNMPKQWQRDGFGQWITQLEDQEIEMLCYDVMHDIILEENMRDGLELRAPHPDTNEPLYGKIPSWVYQSQGWARPDLRERIFDRVCKAFRISPTFSQRLQITTPVELVSYVTARVSFARSKPAHHVPKDVKAFLNELPSHEQPELGFLNALPPKERTSLRKAVKVFRQDGIDWNFTYRPKTEGEPEESQDSMYWLQMERNDRIDERHREGQDARREQLIAQRRARKAAAA